ncbi:MAG TPA: hypothetical protein VJT13_16800 [Xanthobacteraceae bacterium]|nr:hypothetical protein [Xanthobacteraceae bacterium]
MRAICAILLLLLTIAGTARAEVVADRLVQVLNDACVSPTTPEGMIDAGNKIAAAEGWHLLRAQPAPMPFMHNENGPKMSFETVWEFGLPDGAKGGVWISILRPEKPGVKHSMCTVEHTAAIEPDILERALEQRLGALIVRDTKKWSGSRHWFFTEERRRGNCGRMIALFERKPPTLMYVDGVYPNDGNWIGPLTASTCRS